MRIEDASFYLCKTICRVVGHKWHKPWKVVSDADYRTVIGWTQICKRCGTFRGEHFEDSSSTLNYLREDRV